jgi:hypothetical protein
VVPIQSIFILSACPNKRPRMTFPVSHDYTCMTLEYSDSASVPPHDDSSHAPDWQGLLGAHPRVALNVLNQAKLLVPCLKVSFVQAHSK